MSKAFSKVEVLAFFADVGFLGWGITSSLFLEDVKPVLSRDFGEPGDPPASCLDPCRTSIEASKHPRWFPSFDSVLNGSKVLL